MLLKLNLVLRSSIKSALCQFNWIFYDNMLYLFIPSLKVLISSCVSKIAPTQYLLWRTKYFRKLFYIFMYFNEARRSTNDDRNLHPTTQ